jgi:hypothetical protein
LTRISSISICMAQRSATEGATDGSGKPALPPLQSGAHAGSRDREPVLETAAEVA